MSVSEEIQSLIRKERELLEQERESLKEALKKNWAGIRALRNQCSHPNATVGEMYGHPTMDCPDCGYGYIDLRTLRGSNEYKSLVGN